MSRVAMIWHCCISDGVPRRSMAVAAIVGSILNLINQGDVLFGAGRVDFTKVLLTFAVPYCVATYGAVSFRMRIAKSFDRTSSDDSRAKS
ncbi:MAG: nitrate/nitrite transporter NrtS [Reyranella sp.]|nr:nitrate/nitrite transporter NrtS [Reyranella sp.]